MSNTRPICLALFRNNTRQRAHFGLFIPNAEYIQLDPNDKTIAELVGTLIHVVGAPMSGYMHEFKRGHDLRQPQDLERVVQIGEIGEGYIKDSQVSIKDCDATGQLDREALRIRPPPINQNFMAPVNNTTNKRCQEWTMEFLQHLESKNWISHGAVEIAQANRDPPTHGIGLRQTGKAAEVAGATL